jgi:outer membrane protein OmpA-like peptidoglycan-associated protein
MVVSRRHCIGMACVSLLAGCASGPEKPATLSREQEEMLNRKAGIEVEPADGGVRLKLPEVVLFDTNQATLDAAAAPVLSRSATLLNRSSKPISVEGHTDNVGTRNRNQVLSGERAQVVGRALVERGVGASRISYQGYSFERPIASNDTADGRARNRRTEIFLQGETMDTVMGVRRQQ